MATLTSFPTAGADDAAVGSVTWGNPGNVVSNNGLRATAASVSSAAESHYLKATGFDFSMIPADSTINAITVKIDRQRNGSFNVGDARVYLIKGGTIDTSVNKANVGVAWPNGSDAVATYTSWSNLPTLSQLQAADFGVAMTAIGLSASTASADVDYISVTVDYTEPADTNLRGGVSGVSGISALVC